MPTSSAFRCRFGRTIISGIHDDDSVDSEDDSDGDDEEVEANDSVAAAEDDACVLLSYLMSNPADPQHFEFVEPSSVQRLPSRLPGIWGQHRVRRCGRSARREPSTGIRGEVFL